MKKTLLRIASLAFALVFALSVSACEPVEPGTSDPSGSEESEVVIPKEFLISDENGVILTPIVIPANASSKERSAANDLKKYLSLITGGEAKIVREDKLGEDVVCCILIGDTEKTRALGYEKPTGYPGTERTVVKHDKQYLVLFGNDDGNYTGTQYAVTMLLEKLGCGWYGTDELWQVVPETKKLDVTGINLEITPLFSSRISRVVQTDPEIGLRWYEGGIVSLTGHWLPQVVPASLYSEHPEWFALTAGSRDPSRFTYWHYCYSNPELASLVAQQAIEKFRSNPNLVSLTITSNDGWDENWCTCDVCKALGNASDQMICFANNVAREVAKVYPDRTLHILSYHNTFLPPENSVALEPNAELMLCRESSMTAPLDTDFKFANVKDAITRVKYTQSWRANAKEYIEKTSAESISVWDWYCLSASSEVWKNIPWVLGETAIRNAKVYADLGADYVFYDHGPTKDYFEDESSYALRWPLWYVASVSAWDSSRTAREILGDACDKLYGAVSEEMLEYYMLLSEISESCKAYSNTWVPPTVPQMYSGKTAQVNAIFESIEAKYGELTENEKARVENQKSYWENVLKITK